MSGLAAASRSLAAILGLLGLATLALSLHAKGFTVGQQRQRSLAQWGPPPLPICSRQTQQSDPACGHPLCKKGSTWQSRGAPLRLFAEGGVGGEAGGPLLLAERSVNRVTLMGRVGLDPEVRQLPSGDRMATFSLATSEQWRDKGNGEVRSRTEWHRVVVFDQGLVDLVEAFVHKGRRVYVEGALQTRRWVAADGQDRYTTEVLLSKYKGELVLLESPGDSSRHGARAAAAAEEGVAAAAGGVLPLTGGNGGPAATLGLRSPGGGVRLPGASGSFDST